MVDVEDRGTGEEVGRRPRAVDESTADEDVERGPGEVEESKADAQVERGPTSEWGRVVERVPAAGGDNVVESGPG